MTNLAPLMASSMDSATDIQRVMASALQEHNLEEVMVHTKVVDLERQWERGWGRGWGKNLEQPLA